MIRNVDHGGGRDHSRLRTLARTPRVSLSQRAGKQTDKSPLTAHGLKDAATDADAIHRMFSPHPDCLIGVPTGSISGIDILDVDPRHDGHVWYAANKERLPPTRIHRTRSGGIHRLFRHMDGLRNTAAKIAPGIDTRSEGGYFIWWPRSSPRLPAHGSPRMAACGFCRR